MKVTLELDDALVERARQRARCSGTTLAELVEDGLRRVLTEERGKRKYVLPDRSVGEDGGRDPLEAMTWPDLRDEIYGGR